MPDYFHHSMLESSRLLPPLLIDDFQDAAAIFAGFFADC